MRILSLLLFGVSLLKAQAPPCIRTFNLTAASSSAFLDNRQAGCTIWTLGYNSTGFSALSLTLQSASGALTPGTFVTYTGTTGTGSNPMTATTQSYSTFTGYVGWIQVNLSGLTGTGTVTGVLYGFRNAQTASAGGSGITILSGDGTTPSGGGPQPLTLATVNSNVGACGDSTHYCVPTFNAKGLATAASTFALPAATAQLHSISLSANGGGSVLSTGALKIFGTADFVCTAINRVDISSDVVGSVQVDIWKANAAIPTAANKISASAPVSLSSAQLAQSVPLTGWTTPVAVNDVFSGTISTVATITSFTIQIWCQ
jgi:hypothetical protein